MLIKVCDRCNKRMPLSSGKGMDYHFSTAVSSDTISLCEECDIEFRRFIYEYDGSKTKEDKHV